jgi:hypothetical protein
MDDDEKLVEGPDDDQSMDIGAERPMSMDIGPESIMEELQLFSSFNCRFRKQVYNNVGAAWEWFLRNGLQGNTTGNQ